MRPIIISTFISVIALLFSAYLWEENRRCISEVSEAREEVRKIDTKLSAIIERVAFLQKDKQKSDENLSGRLSKLDELEQSLVLEHENAEKLSRKLSTLTNATQAAFNAVAAQIRETKEEFANKADTEK